MKKKVEEEIFNVKFTGDEYRIRISDIPQDVLPTDEIDIIRSEEFYYTQLIIRRQREETDQEYEKRMAMQDYVKHGMEKRRYETYLKLKEEFER
jgi:hypothetical protein